MNPKYIDTLPETTPPPLTTQPKGTEPSIPEIKLLSDDDSAQAELSQLVNGGLDRNTGSLSSSDQDPIVPGEPLLTTSPERQTPPAEASSGHLGRIAIRSESARINTKSGRHRTHSGPLSERLIDRVTDKVVSAVSRKPVDPRSLGQTRHIDPKH